jgi:hypothetical protein
MLPGVRAREIKRIPTLGHVCKNGSSFVLRLFPLRIFVEFFLIVATLHAASFAYGDEVSACVAISTQWATAAEDCGCKCVWPYDGRGFSVRCSGIKRLAPVPGGYHIVCEALFLWRTDAKSDNYIIYFFYFCASFSLRDRSIDRSIMHIITGMMAIDRLYRRLFPIFTE